MPTLRFLTPLPIVAILLGCKPEDPGEDLPPPVAAADAAEAFARQICASLFACECQAGGFASEAACFDELRFDFQASIDFALAGGATWNADCAGQLVSAWAKWECLGPQSAVRKAYFDPRVCPVLQGTLTAGADCNSSPVGDDCGEGLVCVAAECVETPVPVPLGSVCRFSWQELPCVGESYCGYGDNGERRCVPFPSAGDSCDASYSCGPLSRNLMCNYETMTCEVGPAVGEPCFQGSSCGPGLYCDGGKNFTCQERFELGDGCSGDAVCPIDASCVGNICQAVAPAACSLLAFGF